MCSLHHVHVSPCVYSTMSMFHRVFTPPCLCFTVCLLHHVYVSLCVYSTVSMFHRVFTPPCLCFTVSLLHHVYVPLCLNSTMSRCPTMDRRVLCFMVSVFLARRLNSCHRRAHQFSLGGAHQAITKTLYSNKVFGHRPAIPPLSLHPGPQIRDRVLC